MSETPGAPGPDPVILVVAAPEHRDGLDDELRARYDRDYDVVVTTDAAGAKPAVKDLMAAGRHIALIALDYEACDDPVTMLDHLRGASPTSRSVVLVGFLVFQTALEELRPALAEGRFDTFLLIPRGQRDEEFHTAIAEYLSDWAWSTADPEVAGLHIVADADDAELAGIRDFLDRMGLAYIRHAPDSAKGARVRGELGDDADLPIVLGINRPPVVGANARSVAAAFYGSPDALGSDYVADLLVVGAGPAGLAAAVYGASEGLATVVLDGDAVGGQAGSSSMIRNYLGFPRGVSGMRLAMRARLQATRFGARLYTGREVSGIDLGDVNKITYDGGVLTARAILLACGVRYRRLGVEAVEDLVGRGVHYGAATSVAREMAGRDVYVVGGGNSAGQAAIHLARFARSVTIVVRRDGLAATMSDYLVREITIHRRIAVRTSARVADGGGDGRLEWLDLESPDGTRERVEAGGLFLLLGADPGSDWLPADVACDARGFVLTGREVPQDRWVDGMPPPPLETSVAGVFAAGDIRAGSMKRVASASGEGAAAVAQVHAYLAGR